MPASDAHRDSVNQEQSILDQALALLIKFARVAAQLKSENEGEQSNAKTLAIRMLGNPGMRWEILIVALEGYRLVTRGGKHWEDLAVAFEAAQVLANALTEAQQRIADLEAEQSRGTAVALWQDVGAKISNTRTAAAWALDLHRRKLIWLSPNDIDFLSKSIPRWTGPLRPKQQAWLQAILDRAVNSTGLTPPTSPTSPT